MLLLDTANPLLEVTNIRHQIITPMLGSCRLDRFRMLTWEESNSQLAKNDKFQLSSAWAKHFKNSAPKKDEASLLETAGVMNSLHLRAVRVRFCALIHNNGRVHLVCPPGRKLARTKQGRNDTCLKMVRFKNCVTGLRRQQQQCSTDRVHCM